MHCSRAWHMYECSLGYSAPRGFTFEPLHMGAVTQIRPWYLQSRKSESCRPYRDYARQQAHVQSCRRC